MDNQLTSIEKQLLVITRQFLLEQEIEHAIYTLSLDASLERQLSIDSLGKAELFHRIEKALNIRFSDKVMAEADTLRAIAQAALTAKSGKIKIHKEIFVPILESLELDLSKINTLQDVLIQYAIHEPDRPHIYFPDEEGNETTMTYGQLLTNASNIANSLINYGIKPNDTVAIMLPTSRDFFQSFMGVLLAGAIPVPIYPPFRPDRIEEYALREVKILNNAEVRFLITFTQAEMLSKILQSNVSSLKAVATASNLMTGKGSLPKLSRHGEQSALIQYTSGSTGDPKGVLLQHKNILANIRAIGQAIHIQSTDIIVSWLPLYHDMGLMSWLGSLYHGIPFTILTPIYFLNRPERWLWAIHYHRATLSAGPNFAYELCVNKVDVEAIEGLDLSSLRLIFNGAEAINPQTLHRFYEKFKHYGLKKETLFPVYGLAENTVALTFPKPDSPPRVDYIVRELFEKKSHAIPSAEKNALTFVSVGNPIPGHKIRIVDDHDQKLNDRYVGNIQFCGPSAMKGYYRNPIATEQSYHNGWWDTGDLGYIADGDLFITGRKKDLIIKAGRNIYPEVIEEIVGNISGIRKGCVVAFGVSDPKVGTEKIIVVAETKLLSNSEKDTLKAIVMEQVTIALGIPPDQILIVPSHIIPKTSSGKLQRSACKQAYLKDELVGMRQTARWQITKLFLFSIERQFMRFLNRLLRLFYTCYVWIILGITLLPIWLLVLILPRTQGAHVLKYWAQGLLRFVFCPIHIINEKNLTLNKPVIYCANHASYSDSLILLAILPPGTLFVGKKELLKTPIISSIMKKLKFITVDRWEFAKNIKDLQRIQRVLELKKSILIFPEGTFTYASGLREFKTGAFQLCVDTQTTICPIAIQNTRKLLRDGSFLLTPVHINVTICELIMPHGKDWQEVVRLRTETHKIIAQYCGEPTLQ